MPVMSESEIGVVHADAWVTTAYGDPTSVMERREVEVRAPGANEVRVAVDAFCLDLNDIDIIRGRYATLMLEPPFVAGMESVGTVESAGPGAEHLLGQRIWASRPSPMAGTPPTPSSMRPRPWSCPTG